MERNLYKFLFLISSSWFWDFKTSRPAAKKRSEQPFFSDFFEGLFLGGQAPSTAPILWCVNLTIWTKSIRNLAIRPKTKTKEDMIFKYSRVFKTLTHYDKRTECLNMFLLQIVWCEKNQPDDLKRKKIKQDKDKES